MCYAQFPETTMRILSAAALILLAMSRPSEAQLASAMPSQPAVIHAAMMLDGRGASTRNVYVVVRNGKIERITTSPVTMSGAATIELGSATLLPGLIDAHVHPGWYVDRQGKRNSQRSGDTPGQAALARAGNL